MTVSASTAQTYPYQDKSLSFYERAKDLVSRMTLEEKISQVGHQSPAISRLGIVKYNYWNEALHGVARSGLATSFPSSKAMSSSWDLQLIYDCATATSDEARVYNNTTGKGMTYWCPTINMSRDPRWGRDEENYGEDPFLTGKLAVQYIKGMQGSGSKYYKTIATAKHFAANNYEKGRHNTSSNMDERNLREYYLPAFEMAVKDANVRSVMSAYNELNETPCCANHELLIDILRTEWGFNGFVTSDCEAIHDIYANHKYVSTAAEAAGVAMSNGEDLNCGDVFQGYCKEAIEKGYLTEAALDTALTRIFEARFSVGEFDNAADVSWRNISDDVLNCDAHKALALKAARECIVLLKNDNNFLPLSKDKTVAVIGPLGNTVSLGGYSGSPSDVSTPLEGIAAKLGVSFDNGTIQFEDCTEHSTKSTNRRIAHEFNGSSGNLGYIYSGDWVAFESVDFGNGRTTLDVNHGAKNSKSTTIKFYLDNMNGDPACTVVCKPTGNWSTYTTTTVSVDPTVFRGVHKVYTQFVGGDTYCANVDWFRFYNADGYNPLEEEGPVYYHIGCAVNDNDDINIDKAVEIAKKADVVVFAAGTNMDTSDEGSDRKKLDLPGAQEKLLEAVYAANPNVVLLLQSCSSLTINWAQKNIPAIVEAWYDGQAQGVAIADVLYGDYNPSGKITSTWYNSLSDLPSDMLQYDIRKNHYTYMYHNKTPLYPFGFGMSYTTFEYSDLSLDKHSLSAGDSVRVTATIKNTGDRDGAEIVQLYAHCQSSIERPQKQLIGFARVELKAGESKTVEIVFRHDQLSYYNTENATFDVEDGTVDIYLGASSADIRLTDQITTEGATVKTTYKSVPAGIRGITVCNNSKNDRIYSLSGTCLGNASDIDRLPRGMYIVSGNKWMKRLK